LEFIPTTEFSSTETTAEGYFHSGIHFEVTVEGDYLKTRSDVVNFIFSLNPETPVIERIPGKVFKTTKGSQQFEVNILRVPTGEFLVFASNVIEIEDHFREEVIESILTETNSNLETELGSEYEVITLRGPQNLKEVFNVIEYHFNKVVNK
jgi:hypothetical protein